MDSESAPGISVGENNGEIIGEVKGPFIQNIYDRVGGLPRSERARPNSRDSVPPQAPADSSPTSDQQPKQSSSNQETNEGQTRTQRAQETRPIDTVSVDSEQETQVLSTVEAGVEIRPPEPVVSDLLERAVSDVVRDNNIKTDMVSVNVVSNELQRIKQEVEDRRPGSLNNALNELKGMREQMGIKHMTPKVSYPDGADSATVRKAVGGEVERELKRFPQEVAGKVMEEYNNAREEYNDAVKEAGEVLSQKGVLGRAEARRVAATLQDAKGKTTAEADRILDKIHASADERTEIDNARRREYAPREVQVLEVQVTPPTPNENGYVSPEQRLQYLKQNRGALQKHIESQQIGLIEAFRSGDARAICEQNNSLRVMHQSMKLLERSEKVLEAEEKVGKARDKAADLFKDGEMIAGLRQNVRILGALRSLQSERVKQSLGYVGDQIGVAVGGLNEQTIGRLQEGLVKLRGSISEVGRRVSDKLPKPVERMNLKMKKLEMELSRKVVEVKVNHYRRLHRRDLQRDLDHTNKLLLGVDLAKDIGGRRMSQEKRAELEEHKQKLMKDARELRTRLHERGVTAKSDNPHYDKLQRSFLEHVRVVTGPVNGDLGPEERAQLRGTARVENTEPRNGRTIGDFQRIDVREAPSRQGGESNEQTSVVVPAVNLEAIMPLTDKEEASEEATQPLTFNEETTQRFMGQRRYGDSEPIITADILEDINNNGESEATQELPILAPENIEMPSVQIASPENVRPPETNDSLSEDITVESSVDTPLGAFGNLENPVRATYANAIYEQVKDEPVNYSEVGEQVEIMASMLKDNIAILEANESESLEEIIEDANHFAAYMEVMKRKALEQTPADPTKFNQYADANIELADKIVEKAEQNQLTGGSLTEAYKKRDRAAAEYRSESEVDTREALPQIEVVAPEDIQREVESADTEKDSAAIVDRYSLDLRLAMKIFTNPNASDSDRRNAREDIDRAAMNLESAYDAVEEKYRSGSYSTPQMSNSLDSFITSAKGMNKLARSIAVYGFQPESDIRLWNEQDYKYRKTRENVENEKAYARQ